MNELFDEYEAARIEGDREALRAVAHECMWRSSEGSHWGYLMRASQTAVSAITERLAGRIADAMTLEADADRYERCAVSEYNRADR